MVREVLQENAEDFDDAVGEDLREEEGHGPGPAPASVQKGSLDLHELYAGL